MTSEDATQCNALIVSTNEGELRCILQQGHGGSCSSDPSDPGGYTPCRRLYDLNDPQGPPSKECNRAEGHSGPCGKVEGGVARQTPI